MIISTSEINEKNTWDNYVSNHGNKTPYHLFGWGAACSDTYNHQLYYIQAKENDQIVGILPLVYIKPPFMHGELVSLPFCDIGGALCNSSSIYRELISEAVKLANRLDVGHIELRNNEESNILKDWPGSSKLSLNISFHRVPVPVFQKFFLSGTSCTI